MLNVSIIYAYLISNIYGYKNNNTCIHTFIDVMIEHLLCQVHTFSIYIEMSCVYSEFEVVS